jgi:hypothetical protein
VFKYLLVVSFFLATLSATTWSEHSQMTKKDESVKNTLKASKQALSIEYLQIKLLYRYWLGEFTGGIPEKKSADAQKELSTMISAETLITYELLKTSKKLELKLIELEALE